MSAYDSLAAHYDALTEDVDYAALADRYEHMLQGTTRPKLVLDLACGTGTLTRLLANRGYQMIGVDGSAEMLSEAAVNTEGSEVLYLHQQLTELDLYGTVDAVLCSLDSLNYLPPQDVLEALRRVFLFLAPGGVFAFDIHTPDKLKGLDGALFCDERDNLLCLWRCSFDEDEQACYYDFDLFEQAGNLWRRSKEAHVQYAYTAEGMREQLEQAGFSNVTMQIESERMFFRAERVL